MNRNKKLVRKYKIQQWLEAFKKQQNKKENREVK